MKHLIVYRPKSWTVFIEAEKMAILCRVADNLSPLCGDNISELQFNTLAKQGIIVIKKEPSLSRESIGKVIIEL
jgi:hypothetical protein